MWTNPLGIRSIEKRFKINNRQNEFVTTPVHFNHNFPKNHEFCDWGNAFRKTLNFRSSVDPERHGGVNRCLELYLESSSSDAMSKSVTSVESQGYVLNKHTTCKQSSIMSMYDVHTYCMCRNMSLNTFSIEFGPFLSFLR